MTEPQNPPLDELLPGMRAAFFEMMWPGFDWIESLWIRERNGQYQLFAQTTLQDRTKLERFDTVAGRVLEAGERMLDEREPGTKHRLEHTIQYGPAVPQDVDYRELMTDAVFKKIAKRDAPWRLENGR